MVDARPAELPQEFADALEYAALSGPFEVSKALAGAKGASQERVIEAASALAQVCDTNPDQTRRWLMLAPQRQAILRRLLESGQLNAAIERRRAAGLDPVTSDLLDAISGAGQFAVDRVRSALSSAGREWLVRLTTVLDWAGDLAQARQLLDQSRLAIARLQREARRAEVLAVPFVGRDREIAELVRALEPLQDKDVRGVFVSGPPGVGKSALLEQVILRHDEAHDSVALRLDFDRAGLDVIDLRTLTMEAARQMADRIPAGSEELLAARRRTAAFREDAETVVESRRDFPYELGSAISTALAMAGRPLLVVVDTLEALQARGTTHLDQLFDWLQHLQDAGVRGMAILVAGRAPPPAGFRRRMGQSLVLEGLDRPAALELTEKLLVPQPFRQLVVDRAAGVPLAIRLAAEIVQSDGVAALPKDKPSPKLASALLYRILLSRIADVTLRELAHPGLIVRRISADLLREVIAPAAELPPLTERTAREMFEALSLQHWLVEPDPYDPDFVRHRIDIRRDLLPMLYLDKPAQCARIDRDSMRWFAARPDPQSAADALYHRLQLLRRSSTRPAVSTELARSLEPASVEELPEAAQILVRQIAGDFSGVVRTAADAAQRGDDDPRVVQELVGLIQKADWTEGRALVARFEKTGSIDPRSRLADGVRAFWWRAGQWHDANWLLRERDRLGVDDSDLPQLEPALSVARIEMRGEYGKTAQVLSDPQDILRTATLSRHSTAISRHGGLGFRLRRVGHEPLQSPEDGELPDPVSLAFERWAQGHRDRWDPRAVEYVHRRLRSVGLTLRQLEQPWVESQMMASLTPYAGVAVNLARSNRTIAEGAREAVATLLGGSHSPLALEDEISVPSHASTDIEPIAAIANAGLFAEWAEALGFIIENANLRSIGRAADNWRRTMAGDWRYGQTAPAGWGRGRIDEVLAARIERHHRSPDPKGLAFAQLAVWVPHMGSGRAVWELIQRRAPGALEAARAALHSGGRIAAAAALRRYRVPTAFVPSVIALLGLGFEIRGESYGWD